MGDAARERWTRWWPAALAAAAVVLFLAGGLMPSRVFFYRDLGSQFFPMLAEARSGGEAVLPFWTHASSNGRPLLANPGFALLSPLSLLWAVFPHALAFDLFLVAHAAIAAAGMAVLARGLGRSAPASLLAGLALGLGGGVVSAHNLWWSLVALAWAPWVILAGIRACEAPSPRRFALLALALALQADGGMPEVVVGTLLAGGALTLFAGEGALPRRALRATVAWGVSGLWGIALASPQLVPAALHARDTLRAFGFTAKGILYNSLDPRALPGFFIPRWGGSPMERAVPGSYPGAAWTETGTPYILSHYCGFVACALALAAVVLSLRGRGEAGKRRGAVLALAGVAALATLVALGRHVGPVVALVEAVAPLPLRFTCKALFAAFLAVPLLAAFGLDAVVERLGATPVLRRLALLLALVAGLDLALAHRGYVPTMPAAELAEPPLAKLLKARAAELGARDGEWCLHQQRFPTGEWGPPPGTLPPGDLPVHLWQKRLLMSPMGLPFGIRHSFDRLGDVLEDVRYFTAARDIYALPPEAWARELGEASILFVVSPLPDLETTTGRVLLLERPLDERIGVPAGSAYLYRNTAFRPRFEFTGIALGEASVESWTDDHGGMTLRVRVAREAPLLVREALGDLSTWTVTTSDGRPLPLGRAGRCFASTVVPAGEWTIRFEHVPRGWRPSLIAWFVVAAVTAAVLAWPGRRRAVSS